MKLKKEMFAETSMLKKKKKKKKKTCLQKEFSHPRRPLQKNDGPFP